MSTSHKNTSSILPSSIFTPKQTADHIKWIQECRAEYNTRCLIATTSTELKIIHDNWVLTDNPPLINRQTLKKLQQTTLSNQTLKKLQQTNRLSNQNCYHSI